MQLSVPQGICHQCSRSQSEPQPCTAPPHTPPHLCILQETLQDQHEGLLPWAPVHGGFYVHFLQVKPLLPPVLWGSCN